MRNPPAANAAAIYVRVSTERQAQHGVSLDDQERRCRAYCELHTIPVALVLVEHDVSGGVPIADRPRGAELLTALAERRVSHVVAVRLDRLFRSAIDCVRTVQEWDRRKITLHLLDLGGSTLNTSSTHGRFFLTVMAAFAEMERGLIGDRVRQAMYHKGERFEFTGGKSEPLGLRRGKAGQPMRPVKPELEAVRFIFKRRRQIRSLRRNGARHVWSFEAIAKDLNERGYRTKRGGRWHASTVHAIWKRRERYERLLRASA